VSGEDQGDECKRTIDEVSKTEMTSKRVANRTPGSVQGKPAYCLGGVRQRAVPVPERKVVFTVKVPESLVSFIRYVANATGESLSAIVTQALKAFLKRRGYGRKAS
jgi:hypothetical protein